VIASNTNKGTEIEEASKGLKRLKKGTKGSRSLAKGAVARRFGERAMEPHGGLSWFNTQTEVKYSPLNWIYEGGLAVEFPTIWDKVRELGLCYIFVDPEKCNVTLVREFYANWNISFRESTKVKIWGQVVRFMYKRFNTFPGTPATNQSEYFILLERTHTETLTILFVVSIHEPIGQGIIMALTQHFCSPT
ncbi:hypothetical protein HAX54_037982, partial [Datura stramonium]|nr:hypothetical protein [Datura stramonium]